MTAQIHALKAHRKAPAAMAGQSAQGKTKRPYIKVAVLDEAGDVVARKSFEGRPAWALNELIEAASAGVTPLDNPGPTESHGGPYSGSHARYVLRSKVHVSETSDFAKTPQRAVNSLPLCGAGKPRPMRLTPGA